MNKTRPTATRRDEHLWQLKRLKQKCDNLEANLFLKTGFGVTEACLAFDELHMVEETRLSNPPTQWDFKRGDRIDQFRFHGELGQLPKFASIAQSVLECLDHLEPNVIQAFQNELAKYDEE
jgi:hypothetical protein